MKNKFLFLSKKQSGESVIIGVNNIGLIEKSANNDGSRIVLNFASTKDLIPKIVQVQQSISEITTLLEAKI